MKTKVLVCLALPCVLSAPVAGETAASYYAILFHGRKIGYQVAKRTESGGKVTHTVSMQVSVVRAGSATSIRIRQEIVETAKGQPVSFKMSQEVSGMSSQSEGALTGGGKLRVRTTVAGQTRERIIDYPKGALMTEGMRLLSRRKGLKEGTGYKALVFDPSLMTAMVAEVRVGPRVSVDLLGRVVKLVKVTTTFKARLGTIRTVAYVDDEGREQKTVLPLAGMNLELIACSKAYAMSEDSPADFFSKVFLKSPRSLAGVRRAGPISYRLVPTGGAKLRFPRTDSQSVRRAADGSFVVTVKPATPPAGGRFPYRGRDAAARRALRPSKYIQSDDRRVVALAREAVGDAKDCGQAVRRIEKFVAEYIATKDLSVGYASASEVAESRQGDCTEHAVLAAAMSRAVGIPAQIVVGFAYVADFDGRKDVFVPHAWTRALVAGTWVDIDAALGGFDAGHLALSVNYGDPEGFFDLIGTLGYFKIAAVEAAK